MCEGGGGGRGSFLEDEGKGVGRFRAVLVDTEPRAVAAVRKKHPALDPRSVFGTGTGRGNNWAHGYRSSGEVGPVRGYGGERPSGLLDDSYAADRNVAEAIRRRAERCSTSPDFLTIYSIGGGTGSGLGSRVLENIRDEFGTSSFIASCAVADGPDGGGCAPLEAYNSAMAIQWLQAYSDSVLFFQNSTLIKQLKASNCKEGPIAMADLNVYIAHTLSGLLAPVPSTLNGSLASISPIRDLVTQVCPMPELKFVEARTSPILLSSSSSSSGRPTRQTACPYVRNASSDSSWRSLVSSIKGMTSRYIEPSSVVSRSTSVATMGRIFGCPVTSSSLACSTVADGLRKVYTPAPWLNGDSSEPIVRVSPGSCAGLCAVKSGATTLTTASCRSTTANCLSSIIDRADALLRARAYVHWYESYNCPAGALRDAIEVGADIIENYKSLA